MPGETYTSRYLAFWNSGDAARIRSAHHSTRIEGRLKPLLRLFQTHPHPLVPLPPPGEGENAHAASAKAASINPS